MEVLGQIDSRSISYCNVRTNLNWDSELPVINWVVFIIANQEDETLIKDVTIKCLDKDVSCICCAGAVASKIEDYFDEEIILRNIKKEEVGELSDYETSPMTTYHSNFSEGFWFAACIADHSTPDENKKIDDVICIDLTKNGVKKHLSDLTIKYNSGELPSDEEIEEPIYDTSYN